ncbi:hypothetical protein ZIOFF_011715 [Zingiber officinale]|uniref:peptidylprolyl isomerase n=1 Tax=Zingiber officinale TaxID=94328 RepID=A0A8J5HKU9_ZINOF|nr:hypothetical protein ZIOFF_011715 [Zingiber officinale]
MKLPSSSGDQAGVAGPSKGGEAGATGVAEMAAGVDDAAAGVDDAKGLGRKDFRAKHSNLMGRRGFWESKAQRRCQRRRRKQRGWLEFGLGHSFGVAFVSESFGECDSEEGAAREGDPMQRSQARGQVLWAEKAQGDGDLLAVKAFVGERECPGTGFAKGGNVVGAEQDAEVVTADAQLTVKKSEWLRQAKVADVEAAKTVAIRNFDLDLKLEKKEIGKEGLKKKLVKEEEGWDMPEVGDEVEVHYTGTLLDGTKFDSNYNRGTPSKSKLGQGQELAVVPPNNTAYFKEEMMSFVKDKDSLSMISRCLLASRPCLCSPSNVAAPNCEGDGTPMEHRSWMEWIGKEKSLTPKWMVDEAPVANDRRRNKVCTTITVDKGIRFCLNYIEVVPRTEAEEEKLKRLFAKCKIDELIQSVTNATISNARKEIRSLVNGQEIRSLVNGLLSESSIYQNNPVAFSKERKETKLLIERVYRQGNLKNQYPREELDKQIVKFGKQKESKKRTSAAALKIAGVALHSKVQNQQKPNKRPRPFTTTLTHKGVDMNMHVQHISRTCHVGDKDGTAYTLITQKEVPIYPQQTIADLVPDDLPPSLSSACFRLQFQTIAQSMNSYIRRLRPQGKGYADNTAKASRSSPPHSLLRRATPAWQIARDSIRVSSDACIKCRFSLKSFQPKTNRFINSLLSITTAASEQHCPAHKCNGHGQLTGDIVAQTSIKRCYSLDDTDAVERDRSSLNKNAHHLDTQRKQIKVSDMVIVLAALGGAVVDVSQRASTSTLDGCKSFKSTNPEGANLMGTYRVPSRNLTCFSWAGTTLAGFVKIP